MIARAWAAIGRAPMYRVVLCALAVLAGASFVASAVGWLYYSPAELAALLGVVVVVTVGASRLAARLWRAESHDESSLITALLLFFILKPGLEAGDLIAAAVGAAVAGLSKFVLAWRGRHLFNPAAAGAFVVTATGIGASYWWIGSSVLVWAVVPVAAVVVIRLRQALLALVAVLAGLVVYMVSAITWGSGALEALQMAVASTALIFFAAFMVTEPLTLPPRRWQRMMVAVVTGALFAAPIPLGVLSMSPQLALLVGNVIGFAFGQRRAIRLTLRETRRSADGTVEMTFDAAAPIRFRAGQAIELHVPGVGLGSRGGSRRVFSLVSAPSDGREVRVAFVLPEHPSAAKRRLVSMKPGDQIRATGVAGDFIPPSDDQPVVMLAAGIGVTPFISWLREAHTQGGHQDAVLVWAVRDPESAHFRDELAELGARVILVSRTAPSHLYPQETWAGPIRLDGERVADILPDLPERDAYISGTPRFVSRLRRGLRSCAHGVHTDAFAGY
ncbi:MAG TPA: hypothetical protein PKE40_00490 [Arachnia sp.]|nr:hypothetical protein [Arachnia sp.]HMT84803.1 hypothetical protein [Arachnia sp.]